MKILLAIDGTEYSDAAVQMACGLGLRDESVIHIITSVELAIPYGVDLYGGYIPDMTQIDAISKENAAKVLENAVKELADKTALPAGAITSEVLFGPPESSIVEAAEKFGADLIVIGSHGYRSWERLLLGSVSDSVVHHAPCSVMIVRKQPAV